MRAKTSPKVERRRGDAAFAVAVILGVAAFAWVVITMTQLSGDLRAANDARDALAAQVQRLGASPVAGPPGSRGDAGLIGPSGPSGPPGYPGSPGPSGPPGSSGASGKSGDPGAVGASGSPGPVGASGTPGVNGQAGTTGSPGPVGPQGEPGPAGPTGPQGDKGDKGDPGATCPDGYSMQPLPNDPDYMACHRDNAPSPSSPTHGPLGLGAVISAAYRKIGARRA